MVTCLRSRDYRPLENAAPPDCPRGHDRVLGKDDGIYAEHVGGLQFDNVTVAFSTPKEAWYGDCIHICRQGSPREAVAAEDEEMVVDGLELVRCIHDPSGLLSEHFKR